MDILKRLKENLTYSELKVCKKMFSERPEAEEMVIITARIADSAGVARSNVVGALRLLEVAGVLEAKSLGMKGTRIKILDRKMLEAIMKF